MTTFLLLIALVVVGVAAGYRTYRRGKRSWSPSSGDPGGWYDGGGTSCGSDGGGGGGDC